MLGMTLITPQTGPDGRRVRQVLVEEALDIVRELYVSVTVDRERNCAVMIQRSGRRSDQRRGCTPENPERMDRSPARPTGVSSRRLAYALHLEPAQLPQAIALMQSLYRAFLDRDCSLAEINPLIVTSQGLALDAKLDLDDNGLFRHPELQEMRDIGEENPPRWRPPSTA